jgi:hypothetical protein
MDVSCSQISKTGENVCGDVFFSKRYPGERRLIAVLSDGLGSGVKANILAKMTATMLLKYVEAGRDILKAAEVIMNSLPVCRIRNISYSTFTVVDYHENGSVVIVEEGNPGFIWMRNGKQVHAVPEIIISRNFIERKMHRYQIIMNPEDRIIFCSDGVTQAGLGCPGIKSGWKQSGMIEYTQFLLKQNPEISSRQLAELIGTTASHKGIDGLVKDDISAVVLHVRKSRSLVVLTGPPFHAERDSEHCNRFIDFNGKKAICGGTTARIVSRELNKKVVTTMAKGDLPGKSLMEGIDLVSEGILTLTRVQEYLENPPAADIRNAATELVALFMESDCIRFMIGAKMNMAYYAPEWPVELEIRRTVIKRISKILEDKYLKRLILEFI